MAAMPEAGGTAATAVTACMPRAAAAVVRAGWPGAPRSDELCSYLHRPTVGGREGGEGAKGGEGGLGGGGGAGGMGGTGGGGGTRQGVDGANGGAGGKGGDGGT